MKWWNRSSTHLIAVTQLQAVDNKSVRTWANLSGHLKGSLRPPAPYLSGRLDGYFPGSCLKRRSYIPKRELFQSTLNFEPAEALQHIKFTIKIN